MTRNRLGSWEPATGEDRLSRIESLAEIRQLAMRNAMAIDARDLDMLVDLFGPDVRVGRDESGRAALRRWYDRALREPRTSIHWVMNHVVDFEDADHAAGVVHCRDELERPEIGEWQIGSIQYWDRYARIDGAWCFVERKFHRWHLVDALERPAHGAGMADDPLFARQLPEAYPTWGPSGPDRVDAATRRRSGDDAQPAVDHDRHAGDVGHIVGHDRGDGGADVGLAVTDRSVRAVCCAGSARTPPGVPG